MTYFGVDIIGEIYWGGTSWQIEDVTFGRENIDAVGKEDRCG